MSSTNFIDGVTNIPASWLNDVNSTVYGLSPVISPTRDPGGLGFWADVASGAKLLHLRDRLFVGASAVDTGNKSSPYGNSDLSEHTATWPEKNSQANFGSTMGLIGLLGWSDLIDGDTSGTSMGVAGFGRAELANGVSRALYGDITRETGAGAVYGLEVAGTNRGSNVTGNSYTFSETAGVFGLHLTMQGGTGYTVGDLDTPVTVGTAPGTAAINIGAGTGGADVKRWNMGIRFASNAITGTDGSTGTGQAIQLAKGHEINWMASGAILGARIRSDVTAASGHDVSLIFEPDVMSLYGTNSKRTFRTKHASSAVNNLIVQSAASGSFPLLQAEGDDATIGMWFCTQGQQRFSFFNTDTGHEELRIGGVSVSPVNYLHAYGSSTGAGLGILSAKGADTNVSVEILPKGTGALMIALANCQNAANDGAAAGLGVPVGGLYRTTNAVQIRIA